jgi:hypothetical protein
MGFAEQDDFGAFLAAVGRLDPEDADSLLYTAMKKQVELAVELEQNMEAEESAGDRLMALADRMERGKATVLLLDAFRRSRNGHIRRVVATKLVMTANILEPEDAASVVSVAFSTLTGKDVEADELFSRLDVLTGQMRSDVSQRIWRQAAEAIKTVLENIGDATDTFTRVMYLRKIAKRMRLSESFDFWKDVDRILIASLEKEPRAAERGMLAFALAEAVKKIKSSDAKLTCRRAIQFLNAAINRESDPLQRGYLSFGIVRLATCLEHSEADVILRGRLETGVRAR